MAVIFYFTGTGNSLAAAKELSKALSGCRLERMTDYMAKPYKVTDDTVGFVNPVYCFALPPIVREFVKKFEGETSYAFSVVTMGSNPGRSLFMMRELLAEKGVKLSYANSVAMPDNIFLTPPDKAAVMLKEAEPKFRAIAGDIAARKCDTSACVEKTFWKNIGIPAGYWFMRNVLKLGQLGLRPNHCKGCGLCAKICPVGNIKIIRGQPSFQGNCAWCFGCRNWCPEHAIRIGGMRTKADVSYTNPSVTIQEMFRQR